MNWLQKYKWWLLGGAGIFGLYLLFKSGSSNSSTSAATTDPNAGAEAVAAINANAATQTAVTNANAAVQIAQTQASVQSQLGQAQVQGAVTIDAQDNAALTNIANGQFAATLAATQNTNATSLAELQNQDSTALSIAQNAGTIQQNIAALGYQAQSGNLQTVLGAVQSGVFNKGGEGGTNQVGVIAAALNPPTASSNTQSSAAIGTAQSAGSTSVLSTITKTIGSAGTTILGNLSGNQRNLTHQAK